MSDIVAQDQKYVGLTHTIAVLRATVLFYWLCYKEFPAENYGVKLGRPEIVSGDLTLDYYDI